MDLINLMKERYSVRSFNDKEIEQEKLDAILEAGRVAPTATNAQPQRIYVIKSDESLAKLRECTRFHFDANLALLVCYDKNVSWKRSFDSYDMGAVDAAIVTTHMILEITNQGLGTTWVAYFDPQKTVESFELPENIIPVAILPIGYPSETAEPNPRHFDRLEISETVKYI